MAIRNAVIENRANWQKKFREEFDNAMLNYRNQLQQIENPEDPRDRPLEVKQYRRAQLNQKSIPDLRAKAKQLIEQTDLGVKEAHAEYRKAETAYKKSFDWNVINGLRAETLTKLHSARREEIERMLAAAEASDDQNERRAFRSALLEYAQAGVKNRAAESTAQRTWYNSQILLIREWEAADEPAELKELRGLANDWSDAGNQLLQELARTQHQIEPQQFLKPGVFDDLIGQVAGSAVNHPKDGSRILQAETMF